MSGRAGLFGVLPPAVEFRCSLFHYALEHIGRGSGTSSLSTTRPFAAAAAEEEEEKEKKKEKEAKSQQFAPAREDIVPYVWLSFEWVWWLLYVRGNRTPVVPFRARFKTLWVWDEPLAAADLNDVTEFYLFGTNLEKNQLFRHARTLQDLKALDDRQHVLISLGTTLSRSSIRATTQQYVTDSARWRTVAALQPFDPHVSRLWSSSEVEARESEEVITEAARLPAVLANALHNVLPACLVQMVADCCVPSGADKYVNRIHEMNDIAIEINDVKRELAEEIKRLYDKWVSLNAQQTAAEKQYAKDEDNTRWMRDNCDLRSVLVSASRARDAVNVAAATCTQQPTNTSALAPPPPPKRVRVSR